jgi:hypothetical protein
MIIFRYPSEADEAPVVDSGSLGWCRLRPMALSSDDRSARRRKFIV